MDKLDVLKRVCGSVGNYRECEFLDELYDRFGGDFNDDGWELLVDYIDDLQYRLTRHITPTIKKAHRDEEYEFHQWVNETRAVAVIRASVTRPSSEEPAPRILTAQFRPRLATAKVGSHR